MIRECSIGLGFLAIGMLSAAGVYPEMTSLMAAGSLMILASLAGIVLGPDIDRSCGMERRALFT